MWCLLFVTLDKARDLARWDTCPGILPDSCQNQTNKGGKPREGVLHHHFDERINSIDVLCNLIKIVAGRQQFWSDVVLHRRRR